MNLDFDLVLDAQGQRIWKNKRTGETRTTVRPSGGTDLEDLRKRMRSSISALSSSILGPPTAPAAEAASAPAEDRCRDVTAPAADRATGIMANWVETTGALTACMHAATTIAAGTLSVTASQPALFGMTNSWGGLQDAVGNHVQLQSSFNPALVVSTPVVEGCADGLGPAWATLRLAVNDQMREPAVGVHASGSSGGPGPACTSLQMAMGNPAWEPPSQQHQTAGARAPTAGSAMFGEGPAWESLQAAFGPQTRASPSQMMASHVPSSETCSEELGPAWKRFQAAIGDRLGGSSGFQPQASASTQAAGTRVEQLGPAWASLQAAMGCQGGDTANVKETAALRMPVARNNTEDLGPAWQSLCAVTGNQTHEVARLHQSTGFSPTAVVASMNGATSAWERMHPATSMQAQNADFFEHHVAETLLANDMPLEQQMEVQQAAMSAQLQQAMIQQDFHEQMRKIQMQREAEKAQARSGSITGRGAGGGDRDAPPPSEKWVCSECGFYNRIANKWCGGSGRLGCKVTRAEACGIIKPGTHRQNAVPTIPEEARRFGDWNCPNCGDYQFRRNPTCRTCGTLKPADKPLGDVDEEDDSK